MDLIQINPFRILGLPITATEREIAKQINTLATYAEMGKSKSFDTDWSLFADVARSPELIENAKKQIEQSENKMLCSLFWFWKNNATDELAFELLKEGKAEKAIEIWEKGIFSNKQIAHKERIIHENLIQSSEDWSAESDEDHTLQKLGGNYIVDRKKGTSSSVPCVEGALNNKIKNWKIEVDSTWIEGVDNVGYGIVFGREESNYFTFELAADGNYSFNRFVDWTCEKKISWTPHAAIQPNGENHIEIKKIEGLLHFSVNGTLVDTFEALPFFGELFGFKVSNNQKVIFRNFKFSEMVLDDGYAVGIPVSYQNLSNIKNLSTLFLATSITNGSFDRSRFVKGVELARHFFSSENVNEYARLISGDKYVYSSEKALAYYIGELNESLKPFLDKPKGINLGEFIQLFSGFPIEAKQFLAGRYMTIPTQNVEKEIEHCANARKKDAVVAVKEGKALIEKTRKDIEFLKKCSGAEDVQYQILADKLSSELVQCAIDYFNKTKNDEDGLPLYQFALNIAGSISARRKAQENLDSCLEWMESKHLRNCWFCGKIPPAPAYQYSKTIYKENSRGFRSVQYSYVPVEIPRCAPCSKVHSKAGDKLTYSIIGLLILGLVVGALIDGNFIIGGIVGLVAGIIMGYALKTADLAKSNIKDTSSSTISTYPVISKMIREGWQMHQPSA